MTDQTNKRRRLRLAVGSLWALLLVAAVAWGYVGGYSVRGVMQLIYDYVITNPIAPIVYIVIYGLRALTFFPAMWLTIAAGGLFGFIPGLIYGLIGENLSANVAYVVARFFRREDLGQRDPEHRIEAFKRMLTAHAFPTVVVLRASYLPFDLVNYTCGLLRVPWGGYILGSFIGMLPPMITFVSFGATVNIPELLAQEHFAPEQLIDTRQLAISAGLVVLSAIVAYFAHRRRKKMLASAQQDDDD